MTEQWKDIPGYEGLYEISDLGRVLSLCWTQGRLLNPGRTPNGYRVTLYQPSKATHWLHRLLKFTFDPISNPDQYHVVFKDKNRFNVALSNLVWRMPPCGSACRVLLRESQVREIKRLYLTQPDLTQKAIAERYGVKRETVTKIVNGVTWGYINEVSHGQ
jgi:predicted XRE-type DNA-binding protein